MLIQETEVSLADHTLRGRGLDFRRGERRALCSLPRGATIRRMTDEEKFQRFLALCKRMYLRMQRDGTWPWSDSTSGEDVVGSQDSSIKKDI